MGYLSLFKLLAVLIAVLTKHTMHSTWRQVQHGCNQRWHHCRAQMHAHKRAFS